MSHKFLPQQIPNVVITPFNTVTNTKILEGVRSRRLFGIVNTSNNAEMEVRLNNDGTGTPMMLTHKTSSTRSDGGTLEFNGYNGCVWVLGEGYVYYYEG